MNNFEDATLKKLKIERRKKTIRKLLILSVSIIVLGLITPVLLIILSVILMLAGISAMYNIGFLTRREEREVDDVDKAFEKSFYEGIFLSVTGLLLFLITLYVMSIGWNGVLRI